MYRGIFGAVFVASAALVPAFQQASGRGSDPRSLFTADTTTYPILNHGRLAGELVLIRDGDSVVSRYRYVDRNRGQRSETRYRYGASGRLVAAELRPMTLDGKPNGPVQSFEVLGDSVRWTGMPNRSGTATPANGAPPAPTMTPYDPALYYGIGSTPFDQALLVRHLLGRPNRTGRVFPNVDATAEIEKELTVDTRRGKRKVKFVTVTTTSSVPSGVWLDEKNELFSGEVSWFMAIASDAEPAIPALRQVERAYRDSQGEALARRLTKPLGDRPLVIKNGDLFDSERAVMVPRVTIVIRGDRIAAVGPADSVSIPESAVIVDATGKTVMPGLVDMHVHMQLTSQSQASVLQLAGGITSMRDLAADIDVAVSHRDRAATGAILSPRLVLGGFVEGPGAWAGPSEVIVRDEAEAIAWVARYDSLGYKQVKVYNLVHPDLIPIIARETHKRGMRLSGHVPRGLTVPAAVQLGFDEINHAAFLFSTFFQDSLYVPAMRPYSQVASIVAPKYNVDSEEMTALIDVLRRHNVVIDGTFNIWQGGAFGQPSVPSYGRLVKRLHDAGVTLVPGTDANTIAALIRELTLYQEDGIPAPQVLQLATLTPHRVMKDDRDYGSIAVGKVADIAIVNGKPAERIADLEKVEHVVRAGRLYVSQELRAAVSPRAR